MEILRDIENIKTNGTAVTIGKFDGVHLGHKFLIDTLMKEKGTLESTVFTFEFLNDTPVEQAKNLITTETEKEKILSDIGIERLVLYPFTKANASQAPEDFVKEVLVDKLKCRLLVVGDNFCFGKDRAGNTELLQELSGKYGFRLIVVKRKEYEGEPISSTRIREEISKNHMLNANAMLGK